jgi:replicative DNA helicase
MELTNYNKDRKKGRKPSLDLSTMVYGKVPPQAKDLEEAVLGAIMLEKSAFDNVVEILKPECFYVDAHQRIFKNWMLLVVLMLLPSLPTWLFLLRT